jgi:hypothetical protein
MSKYQRQQKAKDWAEIYFTSQYSLKNFGPVRTVITKKLLEFQARRALRFIK